MSLSVWCCLLSHLSPAYLNRCFCIMRRIPNLMGKCSRPRRDCLFALPWARGAEGVISLFSAATNEEPPEPSRMGSLLKQFDERIDLTLGRRDVYGCRKTL